MNREKYHEQIQEIKIELEQPEIKQENFEINGIDTQPFPDAINDTDEKEPAIIDIALNSATEHYIENINEQNKNESYAEKVTHVIQETSAQIRSLVISRAPWLHETEVDDIEQEVNIRIFKHYKKFEGNSSIRTWVHRIAINTLHSFNERAAIHRNRNVALHNKHDEYDEAGYEPELADDTAISTEDFVVESLMKQKLVHTIDTEISRKNAESLKLRMQNLPHEEIAKRVGATVSAVKVRVHRARTTLETLHKDDLEEYSIHRKEQDGKVS